MQIYKAEFRYKKFDKSILTNLYKKGFSFVLIKDMGFSIEILEFCEYLAKKAFENKTNISQTLETEFLLFLSKQTQINKAIEKLGIKENDKKMLLILLDKETRSKIISEKIGMDIKKIDRIREKIDLRDMQEFGIYRLENRK